MTTSVKEQFTQDWQKAQQVSSQKASRLREILKEASSEAFAELKGGSFEIREVSRGALTNLIFHLKEQDFSGTAAPEAVSDRTDLAAVAQPAERPALTWRQLLVEFATLVRERRADWMQLLRQQFKRYAVQVDSDMVQEYGERYEQLKTQFKKAQARYWSAARQAQGQPQRQTQGAGNDAAAKPIEIEVLDD